MDAASLGVLHDLTLIVWVALLFGAVAYKAIRETHPSACWNWSGRVVARPYLTVDAMIVAGIAIFMLAGLKEALPLTEAKPAKELPLTVNATLIGIMVQLGMCVLMLMHLQISQAGKNACKLLLPLNSDLSQRVRAVAAVW